MRGILVVAHGSRAKETEAALALILDMVRAKKPGLPVECAFMEFSDSTVEKGITALAGKGVTEVKVVPYFLFMGVHMKEDIPQIIADCASQFPKITIKMGKHLGVDERLADILVDRIEKD